MRIRNYIIALVFLSLFFVLGKTPSKAAVYQSCSPGVQCTLTCSVHDTYYFSAYNGSDPIVYASCTGHLDGTCTFTMENYQNHNYQISCGSSGGGGGGSGAPTCDEQHAAVLPEWRNPLGDTFYENSIIPLEYKATSNTSIGRPAYNEKPHTVVLLKRAYTPNVVVCDSHVNNFAPCTMEILPDSECPGCDPTSGGRCCVIIRHPDLMPVMKANTNPAAGQSLFIPWVVEVKVEPWWGATCKASGTFNVVSCNDDCPSPICTISESDCGTGYTLTNTGPHCVAHNATCRQTTGCGNQKVCNSAQCYRTEANITKPSSPTNPRITIDAYAFNLSTTEYTRIKKPLPGQGESAVAISATAPSSSSGRNPTFDFNAENYGVNSEWADTWDNCNGVVGEDFCTLRKAENTIPFKSASLSASQILKEGATGILALRYNTQNICNDNIKSSDYIYPRYQVDRLPTVQDISVTGTPNIVRGCSANSYTGIEANRTLTITVKGTDADGVNDINGAVIWLVKEGTSIANDINKLTYFNAATPRTDGNKIGIFVRKSDSNSYVANIVSGNLSNWGNGPTVTSISNQEIITSITRNHYLGTGSDLGKYVFEITLTFSSSNNESSLISGQYNVYAALTDSLSYSNYIDQQNVVDSGRDWNFDFVNPTIGIINTNVEDAQQRLIDVNFTSSDNQGVIKDTVLNIYVSSSPKEVLLINPIPTNGGLSQEPSSSPISPQPGLISPLLSGWYFDSQQQSFKINIQNNSSGNLTFYPTVYDRACNFVTSQSNAIDLNKWIVTKGGILFSSGNIGFSPKDISDDWSDDWNIGTEIIGIGSNLHPVKLDKGEERNPVSITNIIDRNNQNKTAFYNLLVERANLYKKKFNYPIYTDMNLCLSDCAITEKKICICQPTSDFTFSTDTTFNGKFLILTTKNINIEANLTPSPPDSALIILTLGKVNIGKAKSGVTSFGTDTINAFIISLGGIDILSEIDTDPGIQQDQVVVNGGLIGLSEAGNAINILRNLGLMNISQPTLIVNYEPRYAKISELFFGTDTRVYKQDVGFKM